MRKKFLIQKKRKKSTHLLNAKINDFYFQEESNKKTDRFEDVFFEHIKNHTKKLIKKTK